MVPTVITIADRVRESARNGFVGRRRELDLLASGTRPDPPFLVALVHGPGGVGKTALLRRLVADTPAPVRVVLLDGRDVEPTPEGFCRAVAHALGLPAPASVASVAEAFRGSPVLLVVDVYEALGLLDGWLRTRFLPQMPATTVTVLAGRDRPAAAWFATAGWPGLVTELRLSSLAAGEAALLLRHRGLDDEQADWAQRFARGHPLALELAAAAVRADPACVGGEPAAPAGLLDAFLAGLPAADVEVVEAAATLRRVTEPALAAVLGRPAGFERLRRLPFVEEAPDGLRLHDVVRDTVSHGLAVRDPDLRREYRRRALSHLSRPDRRDVDPWQHTADLMFLIENHVVRDACFPDGRPSHRVEPAGHGSAAVIAAIASQHEPPTAAGLVDAWYARHPDSFHVARDAAGDVAAFVQIIGLAEADPALMATDPVAAAWAAHLHRCPPAAGEDGLLMRRWLGRESGELRSPEVSACWLDVKRVYLQRRPRLRRIYSVVVDMARLGPIFVPLGFAPAGDPVVLDGVAAQPVWLDFGPSSVDGWLARLVGAEVGTATAPTGGPVGPGLSSRELEVLRLVSAGRTNRQVGAALFISEKTASRHLSAVFDKLGVRSRAEAVRVAAENGLTAALP